MDEEKKGHRNIDFLAIYLYFLITIIGGTLIRLVCVYNRLRSHIDIPLPAILLILGILFGILEHNFESLKLFSEQSSVLIASEAKYFIIPAFVIRLVFSFDWLSFLKSMTQVFVLGIFVFFISAVLVGGFVGLLLRHNFSMLEVLVMGALLSSTDVDDILDRYRQLKAVRVIIRGEVLVTTTLCSILYDVQNIGIFPKASHGIPGGVLILISWLAALIFGYVFVKLLRRDWFDVNCYIIISIFTSFGLYLFAARWGNFPVIPLIIFSSMISPGTNHVDSELAKPIRAVWESIDLALKMNLAFDSGAKFSRIIMDVENPIMLLVKTVALYLFTYSTRLVLLSYVLPVLAITGFRMDFSRVIVLAWSGLEYTVTLTYASGPTIDREAILLAIGSVLLCQIVNVLTLRPLISFLGLLIPPRSSEMDDIIRRLAIEKEKAKNTLKQNDLFADVHWAIVDQVTTFQAIGDYQVMMVADDYGASSALNDSQLLELSQLREEAQFMILKAQKMSYERQRTQGLLQAESYHILRAEVDAALFQSTLALDISSLRPHWTVGFVENLLLTTCSSGYRNQRDNLYDKWAGDWFYMLKGFWWELFIQLTVILLASFIALHLAFHQTVVDQLCMIIVSAHVVLVGLQFFIEVITARGEKLWLLWHFVDVVVLICGISFLVVAEIEKENNFWTKSLFGLQLLRVLRVYWIYKIIFGALPTFHILVNDMVGKRMMMGYDMAKGFIMGQDETLKLLPMIISNQTILIEMKEMLEKDKMEVFQEVGALQREWPCLTIKIKAQESAHYILHRMALRIEEFHNNGLLDDEETHGLLYTVNETKYKVIQDVNRSRPLSLHEMVRQIDWLHGEPELCEIIVNKTILLNLDKSDTVFLKFDNATGIYIVNYGLVQCHYICDNETLDRLNKYGEVPNIDYPCDLDFERNQVQIKSDGNSFGEIGILTGRVCATTLICKTPVLISYIPREVIQPLLPQLRLKMWKMIAMRVAALLLYRDNIFGPMPMDDIKRTLSRALCPDLTGCKRFFINDIVQVVILVDGKVSDDKDNTLIAPVCVPKTTKWILVQSDEDNVEPPPVQLLVVPFTEEEDNLAVELTNGDSHVILGEDSRNSVNRHRMSVVSAITVTSRHLGGYT